MFARLLALLYFVAFEMIYFFSRYRKIRDLRAATGKLEIVTLSDHLTMPCDGQAKNSYTDGQGGGCYDPPGISLFYAGFQRFWYQMKALYVFSKVQKFFFEKS